MLQHTFLQRRVKDSHIESVAGSVVADAFNDRGLLFVETVPWNTVSVSGAPGANFLGCVWLTVLRELTVSQVKFYVATQNGNIDIGIYQSDGTTLTKIASTGSTAVGAIGMQTIALTGSVTLDPANDYYLGFILDGTGSLGRPASLVNAAVSLQEKMAVTKAQTFPLPATTTLASLSSGIASIPWVRVK